MMITTRRYEMKFIRVMFRQLFPYSCEHLNRHFSVCNEFAAVVFRLFALGSGLGKYLDFASPME